MTLFIYPLIVHFIYPSFSLDFYPHILTLTLPSSTHPTMISHHTIDQPIGNSIGQPIGHSISLTIGFQSVNLSVSPSVILRSHHRSPTVSPIGLNHRLSAVSPSVTHRSHPLVLPSVILQSHHRSLNRFAPHHWSPHPIGHHHIIYLIGHHHIDHHHISHIIDHHHINYQHIGHPFSHINQSPPYQLPLSVILSVTTTSIVPSFTTSHQSL